MSWSYVPFGEIAEFRNGLNYSRESFGAGLKMISVGGPDDFDRQSDRRVDRNQPINRPPSAPREPNQEQGQILQPLSLWTGPGPFLKQQQPILQIVQQFAALAV